MQSGVATGHVCERSWQHGMRPSALQAEKQKEAAIKAAQERAAQDYEREVQQLNAMKLQNEARINEKVKKAKQKARKKEEAVNTEQVCAVPSDLSHCVTKRNAGSASTVLPSQPADEQGWGDPCQQVYAVYPFA